MSICTVLCHIAIRTNRFYEKKIIVPAETGQEIFRLDPLLIQVIIFPLDFYREVKGVSKEQWQQQQHQQAKGLFQGALWDHS